MVFSVVSIECKNHNKSTTELELFDLTNLMLQCCCHGTNDTSHANADDDTSHANADDNTSHANAADNKAYDNAGEDNQVCHTCTKYRIKLPKLLY